MEDSARKLRDPATILGLSGNLTLESLNKAYRDARKQIESQGDHGGAIAELEHAYHSLLTQIEAKNCGDDEESVVSAALLPGLNSDDAASLDAENVVYLRRNQNQQPEPASAPDVMALPEFSAVVRQQHMAPRTMRTLAFESSKSVVPIQAPGSHFSDSLSRLTNVIQSTETITGSLLKKLREEVSVSLDEIQVRTKIPRKYIVSIESDDFGGLPAPVYVRGFIASYLRYLGLGERQDIVDAITENYRSRLRIHSKHKPS